MNPIRREVLNGLFVLVISTLLSAAIAAFQIKFNLQVWLLILIGVAVAVSGYVTFEIALGMMTSTEEREEEWLKRVGTPARLALNQAGVAAGNVAMREAVKAMRPGSDYTVMFYFDSEGGRESPVLTEIKSEPKLKQSDDQISFAAIERKLATMKIEPDSHADMIGRLQAGNVSIKPQQSLRPNHRKVSETSHAARRS